MSTAILALDAVFETLETCRQDATLQAQLCTLAEETDRDQYPFAYGLVGRWHSLEVWCAGDILTIEAYPRAHPDLAYSPFVGSFSRGFDNGVIHDMREREDGLFVWRWSQIIHTRPARSLHAGAVVLWPDAGVPGGGLRGLTFRTGTPPVDAMVGRWRLARLPDA